MRVNVEGGGGCCPSPSSTLYPMQLIFSKDDFAPVFHGILQSLCVSGLQVVMSAIAKAIGPLVNIALLLLFAIIIFAIIGLEFYAGALNKTCYDIQNLGETDIKKQ
jgi:hypothetical protein